MTFRGLLREPLIHFLILGAALFLIGRRAADGGPDDRRIVITEGQIQQLAANFARTWQRPPTQDEIDGLIEDRIREEIYYRESLAMGLDRDDTIIRRRLRQKLEFLTEDMADAVEPTREELRAFLASHREKYRIDPRYSFRQVYFSAEPDPTASRQRAEKQLEALRAGKEVDDADASLLPAALADVSDGEIRRIFGNRFGDALASLEPGVWHGPVRSDLGLHLVRIQDRVPGHDPTLDEVLPLVERDWRVAKRDETNEALYQDMRARYTVIVAEPEEARDAD